MGKIYQMNLSDNPFDLLKNGQKSIEMRLNKNGRDKIIKGDHIVFTNEKNLETIEVEVVSVSKFSSFNELYKAFPKEKLGYKQDEIANPNDMLIYYKKEDIEKFGVLAIEVKLV